MEMNGDDFTDEEFEQTSHAMISIQGDKLDPEEITKLLGVEPNFACKKGVKREVAPGTGLEIEQPTGVWQFEVRDLERTVYEPKINKVLDLVTQDLAKWKKITSRFEAILIVGAIVTDDDGGLFKLSPRTMRRLAERGVTLEADVEHLEDGEDE